MHSKLTPSISTFFIALLFANISNAQLEYPLPHPEGYVAYQVSETILIDGFMDENAWALAAWTNPFVDIEGTKKPNPYLETKVKMLWDSTYFYFAATLKEPHLWATLQQRDTVIFYDNDIEIFIDPDGDTHGYYELEMNAFNTLWDLLLPKPYREGGPAIDHWDINGIKSAVRLVGTLNEPLDIDQEWTVEVAIPWNVLEEYASHAGIPIDGEQWRVSYSRVHYDLDIVNNKYVKRKDENGKLLPEYNWTWTPQWVVNMHRPETWGYVQFEHELIGTQEISFNHDPDFDLKMAFYEVYFAQSEYLRINNAFAKKFKKLNLSDFNTVEYIKLMRMEVINEKYIVRAVGHNGTFFIDEEGRLWSE